jgi:hypothetical protein
LFLSAGRPGEGDVQAGGERDQRQTFHSRSLRTGFTPHQIDHSATLPQIVPRRSSTILPDIVQISALRRRHPEGRRSIELGGGYHC